MGVEWRTAQHKFSTFFDSLNNLSLPLFEKLIMKKNLRRRRQLITGLDRWELRMNASLNNALAVVMNLLMHQISS